MNSGRSFIANMVVALGPMPESLVTSLYRRRLWLRRRGIEVVRSEWGTLLGLHLWKLFEQLQIGAVLDVGARQGEFGLWLRRNGYDGWIFSFEPVRESYDLLRQRADSDARWMTYNFALGREAGQAEINVTKLTFFSSFRMPASYATKTFGSDPEVTSHQLVQIKRLDDIFGDVCTRAGGSNVYLKLDTQGWDLEVLRGGTQSLPRIAALQTEIASQQIYEEMPTMRESLDFLQEAGFDLSGFFTVNVDSNGRAVEFDCVAIQRPAVNA